ncbi:hypothetical protein PB01_19450 [Psychrobacillus glaciei]|uniref:Uncharacterized protein n=1 Tax=Psychrobacillus glaciei TaxID=2283160 RepID=A0A5J6SS11_9BACI|nr:hypothetical protein [Psychrobacillus glaciei]QFG00796.1 hypothetical protein PB01_19450 [Psychrobacillus glaciei]
MEFENLLNKVDKALFNLPQHSLKLNKQYKEEFLNVLRNLYQKEIVNNYSKLNSFFEKIQLNKKFDKDVYFQGVSEIVFWNHVSDKGYKYNLEKKLNQQNNFDIDLQVIKENRIFNFEIKCPKITEYNVRHLNVNTSYRFTNKKDMHDLLCDLNQDIFSKMVQSPLYEYENINYKKLEDNKLVDYLKSGQQKFVASNENSINILVISIDFSRFFDYWGYLYNEFSGLFTNNTFFDSNSYNKVDVVLLTNILDGHINLNSEIESWNLNSYFNLFCKNPNSIKFKKEPTANIYNDLFRIIPNDTNEFNSFCLKYSEAILSRGIGDPKIFEYQFFLEYAHSKFPYLKNI